MASTLHFLGLALEADWVEAWGTWVGGIGTGLAVVYAARGFRAGERGRQQDAQEAREAELKSQAAQVRAVVLFPPAVDGHVGGRLDTFKASVGNYSLHPITNIAGRLIHRPSRQEIGVHTGGPDLITVLRKDTDEELKWDLKGYGLKDEGDLIMGRSPAHFDLEVNFTDVHGTPWGVRPGPGEQPFRLGEDTEHLVTQRGLRHRVREAARALRGS